MAGDTYRATARVAYRCNRVRDRFAATHAPHDRIAAHRPASRGPGITANNQRVKPSSSSFAQSIACWMVWPDTSFDTMVGMVPRFHICTAMSGGADEPVM